MSKSKMNQYQDEAYAFSNLTLEKDGRRDLLIKTALGLTGEAGECADIVKKVYFHSHLFTDEMREKLKLELGDVLWYLAVMAKGIGFTLEEVADACLDKLHKRYQDGKFSVEESLNRTEEKPAKPIPTKFIEPKFDREAAVEAVQKTLVKQMAEETVQERLRNRPLEPLPPAAEDEFRHGRAFQDEDNK